MTQRNDLDAPAILTQAEAADLLRVSPRTFQRYVAAGRVTALRTPGGQPRFRREDVEALLTEQSA
jgi:excisionase family DNA binding protein